MEAPRGLALELSKNDKLSISAVALDDEYTDECIPDWRPITCYRREDNFFGFSFGLEKLLNEINPDCIHIHGLWVGIGIQSALWAKRKGIPYILSPHGMMDEWAWKKSRIKKAIFYLLLQKKVLKKACYLHALNLEEKISIKKIIEVNKIFIQPNGINFSDYCRESPPPRSFNKLLYLGRLDPKKSVLELIKVWKKLIKKIDKFDWELVVAGSGSPDYERSLKQEAEGILGRYISFKGHVSGKIKFEIFKNADAFILPSKSEGLPVVILEAWAASLPVAMTKECNLNKALESKLAFQVYPDLPRLEKSLSEFLSLNDHVLANMGGASHDYVKKFYSWGNIAGEFTALYFDMVCSNIK